MKEKKEKGKQPGQDRMEDRQQINIKFTELLSLKNDSLTQSNRG